MLVDIHDDADNWRKWGELVRSWIFNPTTRPADTAAMQAQIDAAGIIGTAPTPNRSVHFVDYNDATPLYFPLPTTAMVLNDEANLNKIAAQASGQRQYPLPIFYSIAFGGAPKVDLAPGEMLAFGKRRLGEYTIQECQ